MHGQNIALRTMDVFHDRGNQDTLSCTYYFQLSAAIQFPARTGQFVPKNPKWNAQAPEEGSEEYDPFPADVYMLAHLIEGHQTSMRPVQGACIGQIGEINPPSAP